MVEAIQEPSVKPRRKMFRSTSARLSPEAARRQGALTNLALLAIGKEAALRFLNERHEGLGGRPIDLAVASDRGLASASDALSALRLGG